jgi:DNA primase
VRIRREDVEAVRERSRIEDVVSEYVTLRPAGVGSLKGLCPFHDEKSPSFNVRPTVGFYHCFGCQKGGDVISFVMEIDGLAFAEAVERLAARVGIELRYEDDGGNEGKRPGREGVNQRRRMLEANRAAAQFYTEQLGASPDASIGRQFLVDRGFDQSAAELFGVGFAPRGGEVLTRHLLGRGFTREELVSSGLSGEGRRGLYDRFRGRLMWPIRDVTGDTLGFGARRLFDDDSIEAKYLNTPETALYKKSHVLYGVDLAKREIAKSHQVIVVEGYTDVMACHLAGEATAVATCGTAFAADHIRIVRRLIGDERNTGGKVIFTFDGDAAGQKAALRAFEDDQRFVSQTYVAIAPSGMDPCDLRQRQGNEAVRELIGTRRPMYEFKIQSIISEVDLTTVEGSARGLRLAAPVVAGIRDEVIRGGYVVKLAGMLGLEDSPVRKAVSRALRELRSAPTPGAAGPGGSAGPGGAGGTGAAGQGANGGRRGPGTGGGYGTSGGRAANEGRGGTGGAAASSRGVLQPDGSWLMPDGTYFHQPEPEPKKGGWKRDEGRGGSRGNRGDWQQRNGWQRNGSGPGGQGVPNGQAGMGGFGWTDHEPPPEDVPPPADEDLPPDAYVTGPGHVPTPGEAPRRFQRPKLAAPNPGDPIAAVERQALECLLQVPRLVPPVDADDLSGTTFQVPAYRAVHDAIRAAGGMAVATGMTESAWVTLVQDFAPDAVVPMITELAVAPLPADREDEVAKYAASVVLKVAETALVHRIGDLRSRVQRMGADEDASAVFAELIAAENDRRLLRDRINGNT